MIVAEKMDKPKDEISEAKSFINDLGADSLDTVELMMDIDWNSVKRMYEINMTYQAAVGGLKGTSTTTNTWLATFAS